MIKGYDRRVNFVTARNIYPYMQGPTLSQLSAAQSDYHATVDATSEGIAMPVNTTSNGTEDKPTWNPNSKPLLTWIALIGLLIVLMFSAQRFGSSDQRADFANIKLSAFNVIVIALSAVIGITFLRLVFTRFYIPGVSELVNVA